MTSRDMMRPAELYMPRATARLFTHLWSSVDWTLPSFGHEARQESAVADQRPVSNFKHTMRICAMLYAAAKLLLEESFLTRDLYYSCSA